MTKNAGPRGLIRTTVKGRAGNDQGNVDEDAERCDSEDNRCNGNVDLPKVTRQRATEKQQRELQHLRQ